MPRKGFPVSEADRVLLALRTGGLQRFARRVFETYTITAQRADAGEGDIFKNPALAKTLRLIGRKAATLSIKERSRTKIDKFMQETGGFLRKVDFEKHTSTWVDPVSSS